MRISVRTVRRNMYKQLRETRKYNAHQEGLTVCCVAFVMAFRKRNGTSHQAPEN
jgi:hypothetical protein